MSRPSQTESLSESFDTRHIGPRPDDIDRMLVEVGAADLDELIADAVPKGIISTDPLDLPGALSEVEVLEHLTAVAANNRVLTSLIGMGYHDTVTPPVIARNILENPAWYTAYTPYQPEISQGRLEALLNFQTMVTDLTGMEVANASLLDEGTAAAEAMAMCRRLSKASGHRFVIDPDCHPQTIAVVETRARALGIEVSIESAADADLSDAFGVLVQCPGTGGAVFDHRPSLARAADAGVMSVVAADLLALVLLEGPGAWGADIVVGTSQRFGVPLGFGGPHAAYIATRQRHVRAMPGRLVGVSQDSAGRTAYRLALQTREQHIRREKATSNVCTAQVLLAVMAGMYAVWHGPDGLNRIARRVAHHTGILAGALSGAGYELVNDTWFDTVTVRVPDAAAVMASALERGINLRAVDGSTVGVALDETTTPAVVTDVLAAFGITDQPADPVAGLPADLLRVSAILTHPVFSEHRSEHEMLRYLRRLADKDLALDRSMIPLGSCTMKLNATTEMIPVTWPELARIHPFVPLDQAAGHLRIIEDLERWLCEITGYDAVSLQPNAGSQGEFAGLLAISDYHRSRGDGHRTVCLIPASAHGTNAASAAMAGMRVVVVACDQHGNVDLADLEAKAKEHSDRLAAAMVTYPSTHGVFEEGIVELCRIVHEHGGQVYVDGANLNALVGVARPGRFGADVSHLNLHKTFTIPHGGGGPGVGPVGVKAHLAPFLPGSVVQTRVGDGPSISAAPWGSASILPISWVYIAMMGQAGLTRATKVAILAANYVAARLEPHYPILYRGDTGRVAHECILDLRGITHESGVTAEDVAKRLADYGFHAPTLSFPVAGTLMVEPTESESLHELDRFVQAMIGIRGEIDRVQRGEWPADDNPLHNAPHTAADLMVDDWQHPYPRRLAAFPAGPKAYFPPVSRIDGAAGDRNLVCACPPIEAYAD